MVEEHSDLFRTQLLEYFDDIEKQVMTENGEWTVKGFIDVYQRIYTITIDTKVLSKVLELLLFPIMKRFSTEQKYELILARAQNQYPDMSFIAADGQKYAVDIKTTYRKSVDRNNRVRVNGMTLGTFMGYFRNRESSTISTFPYSEYSNHYVLGAVYTPSANIDEIQDYNLSEFPSIPSVAKDFTFFFHEKYKIASDRPGSGNTKNIGSTLILDDLINGTGVFSRLGIQIFDDYWLNYQNRQMAKSNGFNRPPYSNLSEYRHFKESGAEILRFSEDELDSNDNEED